MPSGKCATLGDLPPRALELIQHARRAVLSTATPSAPHSVPVCFAVDEDRIVSAVDQKPKRSNRLRRVENIRQNPEVTLLFDRWDEDWSRLAWVMVTGRATVEPPGSADQLLAARYVQYRDDPPKGEVIAVMPETIRWWSAV